MFVEIFEIKRSLRISISKSHIINFRNDTPTHSFNSSELSVPLSSSESYFKIYFISSTLPLCNYFAQTRLNILTDKIRIRRTQNRKISSFQKFQKTNFKRLYSSFQVRNVNDDWIEKMIKLFCTKDERHSEL